MLNLSDTALRELREVSREAGRELRRYALAVDGDPGGSTAYLDSAVLALMRAATTPKEFRTPDMPDDGGFADGCLSRVVAGVEIARGDAGVVAANTGASLAGAAVDTLGDDAQRAFFYSAIADGRSWTCFGMTEPDHGSDATAMQTRLDPLPDPADGYVLTGAKRYVGNASRASVGVVFGRLGRSPLSIRGALIPLPAPGFTAEPLDMIGLRGARICRIGLDGVHVPRAMLLGSHLPASRRGLWGIGRTFNAMRLQVAALALGTALGTRDYVVEQRPRWDGHETVSARLAAARRLLYDAAAAVDHDPDARRPPSAAKLHVTDLAVRTAHWAARALGPGALQEHPLLEKWCRDVRAFEFMDGTSTMQRLHITSDIASRRAGS